ncbi:uncharacterized protein LY89DRAFT_739775 [Mollisia scopiformis]|uniref:Ubiquitin-like domain-containing protein n=1 Tax=Mollisia scopiformis TaxID=149040 RepID=A0A194WS30_MOLSC|nr:uncharacterized protein LY89DRAFT_739775 [Mollisia scopiformis]KUJ10785.1 hypothetical protein LY89DRAFT_739775 [Mollisia scopiformis]
MAAVPLSKDLKVTFENRVFRNHIPTSNTGKSIIRVHYGTTDALDICLRRNLRIKDGDKKPYTPLDCGPFPIYPVDLYKDKLPKDVVAKSGGVVPIYECESLSIDFESQRPFAIKIHTGQVNTVSGGSNTDDITASIRRAARLERDVPIQDYVSSAVQFRLRPTPASEGYSKQFIANANGVDYSVSAQLAGNIKVADLRFETMSTVRKPFQIRIKDVASRSDYFFEVEACMSVHQVKGIFKRMTSYPIDWQELVYDGRELINNENLGELGIHQGSLLFIVLQTVRPHCCFDNTVVKDPVAASDWDVGNSVSFHLHLMNATLFESLLGIPAPRTPVDAALYAKYKYPFYDEYNEKTIVNAHASSSTADEASYPCPKKVEHIAEYEVTVSLHNQTLNALERLKSIDLDALKAMPRHQQFASVSKSLDGIDPKVFKAIDIHKIEDFKVMAELETPLSELLPPRPKLVLYDLGSASSNDEADDESVSSDLEDEQVDTGEVDDEDSSSALEDEDDDSDDDMPELVGRSSYYTF